MLKKIFIFIILIISQFLFGNNIFAEQIPVEKVFTDIDKNYKYYKELQALYNRGMIFPDENGKFNSDRLLNRDEFVGISMEVICKKCISPNTKFEFIRKYSDKIPFYDVKKQNKYFYCISESDNKGFIKGYNKGYKCEKGLFKEEERPFCIENTITLEEALAIILRISNVFSVEDNKEVIQKIYSGEKTKKLADDVLVKNSDGSPYTFYGYFEKALSYEIVEFDNEGNKLTNKLLEIKNGKLRPKKSVSKEDFLKIAYILSKTNNCKDITNYNLAVNIDILNKKCIEGKKCYNKDLDKNDNTFDLDSIVFGICDKGINNDSYTWKFTHLKTKEEIIKKQKYIDNYNFLKSGKWKIDLHIIDNCGNEGIANSTISVSKEVKKEKSLGVDIDAGPLYGKNDLLVDFEGKVKGGDGNYKYEWDYGDGTKGTGKISDHKYTEAGTYIVKLKVIDGEGNIGTSTVTIVVTDNDIEENKNLGVGIDATPLKTEVGKNIDFTGLVEGGNGKYSYEWSFRDGTKGVGKTPIHSYLTPGEYEVKLIVKDSSGKYGTAFVTVIVTEAGEIGNNLGVGINATPLKGEEGMNVDFEGKVKGGEGNYKYEWDYGDGTKGKGKKPNHIYNNPGTYIVELIVTDGKGRVGKSSVVIVVIPKKNVVDSNGLGVAIDVDPLTIFIRDKVNFEGLVEGGDGKYVYIWDFGDNKDGSLKNISHRYIKEGVYNVILEVTDGTGRTGSASVVINVKKNADENNQDLGLKIKANPLHGEEGVKVSFEGFVEGGVGPYTYIWDFKDGNSGSGKHPNHIFENSGTYVVELTVTDANGKIVKARVQIEIVKKDLIVEDNGLTVQAQADIYEGNAKLNVNFKGIVTGGIGPYTYLWNFGRGKNGHVQNPNNTFDFVGINTVKLLVVDSVGNTGERTLLIKVLKFNSCSIDSDGDGVMDCDDKLPEIAGDKDNEGTPILEDKCGEGCSCQEGYVCTTSNPNICEKEGICKPEKKVINECLEKDSQSFIYGNSICLSCPCSYSLKFNESIRKCDMIFPAITSPDSKEIYSRGKIYRVEG